MTLSRFTATQILAIPLSAPEKLFSGPDAIAKEYRALAREWHPDRSSDPCAEDVSRHINVLHDAAVRKAETGRWETPGLVVLECVDGKTRKIRFAKRHRFEIGEVAYSRGHAFFLVQNSFADLFHAARMTINGFRYASHAMHMEMSRFLPVIERDFETIDGQCVMMVKKTPDAFLLRDVLAALGGRLEPKHVAWVLSASYNIACYLEYAGLTHNAISVDTLFVSPEYHSALLLGGWWYSASEGSRLNALPPFGHRLAPGSMLKSRQASNRLDLIMIRAMGRELLGDPTGMNLLGNGVPRPMATFLRQPASPSARADYAAWQSVLEACFGPRRFTKLDLTEEQIFTD